MDRRDRALGLLLLIMVAVATIVTAGGRRGLAVSTSAWSLGGNAFTTSALAAPAGLSASDGTNVVLTWTATTSTNATGYNVLRSSTSGGPYTQIAQVTPSLATTYTDSPLLGTYYYILQSYFQNWLSVNSNQATVNVLAGPFAKMQLLVSGETAAPGTGTGKTGTPSAETAGTPFNLTVNAVDANWNIVASTDTVAVTSSDANGTLPGNAALVAGTQTFSVTLPTVGSWTVTATDITDGTKTANTSPAITVNAGAFTRMQLLVPGETAAPGSATGKTGTPSAETAGTAFNVTVNAVDANWNLVNSANNTHLASSDGNATLPANGAMVAGTRTASVTLKTAGSWTVTASNVTSPAKTPNTSPSIAVNAGAFAKIQLLVPGETAAPGTATGKAGGPSAQTAAAAFNVTVNAVDANWNVVISTDTVAITSSDANATLPANGALVAGTQTFGVTLLTAGSRTLTASDITDGTKTANTSATIAVNAGAFVKMQLLVPGETAAPGTTSGKTGTPGSQTAGTVFTVTINSVDANWNVVSSTNTIGITSSDANATLQGNAALVAGTKSRTATLKTAGSWTITATNVTDGTKPANTSPSITVVVGAFAKMQLLVPGETAAPGTATGKTGTPSAQTANVGFNVTVSSVDANWNVVTSTDTVAITSSDANATLPANAALVAGTQTFGVTLLTAGSRTLTASDVTDGTKTANTSPSITVSAGAFVNMQLLVPGEVAAPGTATGKTGTPSARTAGAAFTVTVNAVDANWNVASSTDTVGITSSDANAALPANAALVAGTKNRSVTLKTAGSWTITATDIADGTKQANTSPSITVVAGAFAKMQLLVPGETAAPGSGTGKTGTPSAETAGTSFNVTVNAVDANWNLVSSADTVGITSSDANATLPANAALVAGTQAFGVTLLTAGSRTVTASDVTDGTKTANTSPAITVNAGAFTKMRLLVPGEVAAPGTATGKTGMPSARTAGTAFNVTVNAVDANWNLVSNTDTVGITSSDVNATSPANAALVGGAKTLSVTLKTAGSWTITATDIADATKQANTSPSITVVAGAFAKMQLLVPGETAAPGSATGKTGTPSAQTASVAFNVTVNAVDANWNLVSSADTAGITSSDGNATLPANAALVAGAQTFGVTLNTVGSRTVTASDITTPAKPANTSPAITVN